MIRIELNKKPKVKTECTNGWFNLKAKTISIAIPVEMVVQKAKVESFPGIC